MADLVYNKFKLSEDVVVVVPAPGITAQPQDLPKDLPKIQPGFELIRPVIGISLVDDSTKLELFHFDPPIQLSVRYNCDDLVAAAKIGRPLKLAYFNGTAWVPLIEAENCFQLVPHDLAAVGVVYVSGWSGGGQGADPPVGWGA